MEVDPEQMKLVEHQIQWTGERLKEVRKARGLRSKDVANEMEISATIVSKNESGTNDMKLSTLLRMCIALGISPSQLLKDCPLPNKSPAKHGQADETEE